MIEYVAVVPVGVVVRLRTRRFCGRQHRKNWAPELAPGMSLEKIVMTDR